METQLTIDSKGLALHGFGLWRTPQTSHRPGKFLSLSVIF